MAKYGISESELNLVKQQAARRATLRKEFLMQRTNPFKHASEAGYVVCLLRNVVINRIEHNKEKQIS